MASLYVTHDRTAISTRPRARKDLTVPRAVPCARGTVVRARERLASRASHRAQRRASCVRQVRPLVVAFRKLVAPPLAKRFVTTTREFTPALALTSPPAVLNTSLQ